MNPHMSQTDPLIHDWLLYIQKVNQTRQNIIRDGKEFCIPFLAISMPVVNTVFAICEQFQLPPNARYTALYLYDKFMCDNFWKVYYKDGKSCPDTATWEQVCQRISSQSSLRLMSCVQIASKMDSHSKQGLSISQVIASLRRLDHKHAYTPVTVLASEFKVFKTVGFKIPLATPLDCIDILIAAVGLKRTKQLHEVTIHLLDLSYLQHSQLYAHLDFAAHGRVAKSEEEKNNALAMKTNVLYLGASIVLCAVLLFDFKIKDAAAVSAKLADLVDVDREDIWIMAKVLFTMGRASTN